MAKLSVKQVLSSRETPEGTERLAFWDSRLAEERKTWASIVGKTFAIVSVAMFIFLSIYFGSYYQQDYRESHITVLVIDLDSVASPSTSAHPAILGPAMAAAIDNNIASSPDIHLGWILAPASQVQSFRITQTSQGINATDYAIDAVRNQDYWAVVVIAANATSGVWSALTAGTEWDASGAMALYYSEARNFYTADQHLTRLSISLFTEAIASAGSTLVSQILALSNATAVLAAAPSGTVSGAFFYNQHNLEPFDQLGGIPSTTVGTVYLIIFTFLISLTWNNLALPIIADKLTLLSEVLVKIGVPIIGYFWLSLNYSLVSLAFQVSFTRRFGKGGFPLYWMENFVTMSALGLVMETMYIWLGPYFPFFLLFWVVLNVSTAFLDLADMQYFFSYGFFLPVWNLVDMSKATIFATKNHLAQNFAVNLGWLLAWTVIMAITVARSRQNKEEAAFEAKYAQLNADEKEDK
ncbi:hypothetical protein P7C73_g851, partial [Tremellales sp. Uapishka_1]